MSNRIRGHVTVENTGKGIKFQQILAWLTMLFGAGLWMAGSTEPGAAAGPTETLKNAYMTMGGAAAWMVVLRVLRWWHHD